jgi:hypothetical protein
MILVQVGVKIECNVKFMVAAPYKNIKMIRKSKYTLVLNWVQNAIFLDSTVN